MVAVAGLASIPVWSGHAMMNIKDIPVAAGYALVTWGLVRVLVVGRERWSRLAATSVLLVAGTVLAVGTRPGIWPGIAGGVLITAAIVAARVRGGAGSWRSLTVLVVERPLLGWQRSPVSIRVCSAIR